MATTDFQFPPRFFKVFISHFSSDFMVIPISYYDQLPRILPRKVILQGPGGCSWNVATKIIGDDVHFAKGWVKFVEDNTLSDGDFLTFVYNGDNIFEVSIYRSSDGCKETSEVTEVEEDKEDNVCSLSSDDTYTCSKSKMKKAILKGKSKVEVVEDSDEKETDTDTSSEFKIAKTIPKRMTKGKKRVAVLEESSDKGGDSDSDSNYNEVFGQVDLVEKSNSEDNSYALDNEDTATSVKAKVPKLKLKRKVEPKIKNPEIYLDDPKNLYFETNVKNRLYELLVPAQLVKDYSLTFGDHVDLIDSIGKLRAIVPPWKDQRVCISQWMHINKRNKLKKEDRVLCELLRRGSYVYAIKLHVIRAEEICRLH